MRAASAGDDLPDGLRAAAMCRPPVPRQPCLRGAAAACVPHTTCKVIPETCCRMVPHTTCSMEPYTVSYCVKRVRAGVRADLPDVPVIRPEAGVRRQESGVGESRLLTR